VEIEERDDKDEETLIEGNLFSAPVDAEEGWDVRRWDKGSFESSLLLLLLLSLLFASGVDIENGPIGNSTNSTRTVPEALWRGEGNSTEDLFWRGEGLSSCSLGAALYAGDLLQQNQL